MMAEMKRSKPESALASGRTETSTTLLNELPYMAIIVIGLVGTTWTSISSTPRATYWVILTPITALICIAAGWSRSAEDGHRVAMAATQIGQWAAVLVAMYLITVSDTRRVLNSDAIGLMLLTLLALGVLISGLSLRVWRLCVTAVFLAVAVPITAWVEQATLLLLIIGGVLIALGFLNWWAQSRSPQRAA
jgi:hypothetical protein